MPNNDGFHLEISTTIDRSVWNNLIAKLPNPHILQTYNWAKLKQSNGWTAIYLIWRNSGDEIVAAASIHKKSVTVFRGLTAGCILYSPRGPILEWGNTILATRVIQDLHQFARKEKGIFLKIDPEVAIGWSDNPIKSRDLDKAGLDVQSQLEQTGWIYSPDQLQFKNTVLLDLQSSENELLAKMKQKTRYNIRLAQKKVFKSAAEIQRIWKCCIGCTR